LENSNSFKGASDIFSLGAKYKIKTGDLEKASSLTNTVLTTLGHQWIEVYSKKYDCYYSFGLNAYLEPQPDLSTVAKHLRDKYKHVKPEIFITSPDFIYWKCKEKVAQCDMLKKNLKEHANDDCTLKCTGIESYNNSKETPKKYGNPNFRTLLEGRLNFVQLRILDHIIKKRKLKKVKGILQEISHFKTVGFLGTVPNKLFLETDLPPNVNYSKTATILNRRQTFNDWINGNENVIADCHTFTNDFHYLPVTLYKTVTGSSFDKSVNNQMSELEKRVVKLRWAKIRNKVMKKSNMATLVNQAQINQTVRDKNKLKSFSNKYIGAKGGRRKSRKKRSSKKRKRSRKRSRKRY